MAENQQTDDTIPDVPIVEELAGRERIYRQLTNQLNKSILALSLLAIPVGIISAYGASAFRYAFGWLWGWLHTEGHMSDALWQWAGLAAGGLLIGIFLAVMKWDSFRTMAHVIVAANHRNGKLTFKEGIITAIADSFSLALGAAVGRYGPAVQLGATLGSTIGQKMGMGPAGLRVLLGCGVAGAISASFNAPIAGAIFAHEVIIGHFALRAFAPVALSSVAAVAVTRYHGLEYIALKLHDIHRQLSPWDYPVYILIGIIAALVALLFMNGIIGIRWSFRKIRLPIWMQPMIGGVLAGAVGIYIPKVLGLGDHTIQQVMEQDLSRPAFTLGMLATLLGGKLLASTACLGCRFPGGMFSPALFIGAMLGGMAGMLDPYLDYQICVLVGMGAVVASVVGAPIATILIVFELTENYAAATAVMVGVVASNAVVNRFFAASFFDRQVKIWGYDSDYPPQQRIMEHRTIAPLVSTDYVSVLPQMTASQIAEAIDYDYDGDIFVVDSHRTLLGKIPLGVLVHCRPEQTAEDLTVSFDQVLSVDDTAWHGFISMQDFTGHSAPVVDHPETGKMMGVVTEAVMIKAYRSAVAEARKNRWA